MIAYAQYLHLHKNDCNRNIKNDKEEDKDKYY